MAEPVCGYWTIELNTRCPKCLHWFDVVDADPNIFDSIQVLEHDTPQTEAVATECPQCGVEFTIKLVY